ncbi:MAG: hypothetical protein S4CHLAM123_14370 [Chlamydiales bacterium]|nr:hypothetical protein [Chlamydiales bacterium]
MCFSAEASFSAAVVLTVAGVVLVGRFYNSKKIFLALIPLFFGIQQFAEGIVWIGLKSNSYPEGYSLVAQYLYLFFAEMFWPVWIPLAFALVEKIVWRQVVMGLLIVIGLGFFFNNGYNFVVHGDARALIKEHSINYGAVPLFYRVLYGIITMMPFFLSSIRKMWILGIANVLAFVVASVLYNYAFISIWCAAAAVLAIGLFFFLKKNREC